MGEIQQNQMSTESDRRRKDPPTPPTCTPLRFQTLIYNFNISNFHSGAHFPNVIFQFMSNCVTIFLNLAYDKLGGGYASQIACGGGSHTRGCLCVCLYQRLLSILEGNDREPRTPAKSGLAAKYVPQGYRTIILS